MEGISAPHVTANPIFVELAVRGETGKTRRTRNRTAGASVAPSKRVRFAVVGLGHIAQSAVLPAFAQARRHAELAALVTDDAGKLKELGRRYGVDALYDYAGLTHCLTEESIDAVYVATPNTEHVQHVLTAARRGVHVLCEKPLGVSERECLTMIRACEAAGVHLMTAYRLHFEAANLAALKLIRSRRIGEPRAFLSAFSYQIVDRSNIRLRGDLGGGPLADIGIYCINAARTVFAAEPAEVQAWSLQSGDPRFREVDETVTAQLRFPGDRVAQLLCSFGAAATGWYQVLGTKGSLRLEPAYEYAEGLTLQITVGDKKQTRAFNKRGQFAAELIYFADCIRRKRVPEPSGWEGLADVRVIEAIQQSIRGREAVKVRVTPEARHPKPRQRIDRPPIGRKPKLVHARAASG